MSYTLQIHIYSILAILLVAADTHFAVAQSDPWLFDEVIDVPPTIAPDSIGSNTQLNLVVGGEIGFLFNAGAADGTSTNIEVNITGGIVGVGFDSYSGSTINIQGGLVHGSFDANSGSVVNINGGLLGGDFDALSGSIVNINGGSVGGGFNTYFDSTVNINGGSIGDKFDANSGSTVNISGGTIGNEFKAHSKSTVNLFGTAFHLNDAAIDLMTGETVTINERDARLSSTLLDGSVIEFNLNQALPTFGDDYFAPNATITVTLVPEPWTLPLFAVSATICLLFARRH